MLYTYFTSTTAYALQPQDQAHQYITTIPEKIVLAANGWHKCWLAKTRLKSKSFRSDGFDSLKTEPETTNFKWNRKRQSSSETGNDKFQVMGSSSSKFKKYLQHGDEYAAMQVSFFKLF